MKFFKEISAVVLIGIFLSSCEKDEVGKTNQDNNYLMSIKYELNNIPLDRIAKASMRQEKSSGNNYLYDYQLLAQNPDDPDDEKINNLLFKLTEACAELIKDIAFNQIVIDMASNSETNTANLLELETVAPNYFSIINQNLSTYGLSLQLIADSLTHQPIAPNMDFPETAEIESYVPAIFVSNLNYLDASLQPLISSAFVVDSRSDETLEDNIIGWYYEGEEDSIVNETLIDEESSLNTTNPLFFIDNAVTTLDVEINPNAVPFYGCDSCIYSDSSSSLILNKKNKPFINHVNQLSSTLSFSSKEHRIKGYHYESWFGGKSEFTITGGRIDQYGNLRYVYPFSRKGQTFDILSKISRSDVSNWKWQNNWEYHAFNWQPWYNSWNWPASQYGVNYVYWNTYERDWYRSAKPLGKATRNGNTIVLSGNRKHTSEWYAWGPSTLWLHNTQFVWINFYGAHWNNSWKADYRIWKVFI